MGEVGSGSCQDGRLWVGRGEVIESVRLPLRIDFGR